MPVLSQKPCLGSNPNQSNLNKQTISSSLNKPTSMHNCHTNLNKQLNNCAPQTRTTQLTSNTIKQLLQVVKEMNTLSEDFDSLSKELNDKVDNINTSGAPHIGESEPSNNSVWLDTTDPESGTTQQLIFNETNEGFVDESSLIFSK